MHWRERYEIPEPEIQERDRRRGLSGLEDTYQRFATYNRLLDSLTDGQASIIAGLLESEKIAGVGEVLAFLSDGKYHLVRNDVEIPLEPFDTPYHYDFTARMAGDNWPDERDRD